MSFESGSRRYEPRRPAAPGQDDALHGQASEERRVIVSASRHASPAGSRPRCHSTASSAPATASMMAHDAAKAERGARARQATDVHAERARDEGERQEHGREDGEREQDAVGALGQPVLDVVAYHECPFARRIELLDVAQQPVVRLAQRREVALVQPVGRVQQQARERLALRVDVASRPDDAPAQRRQLAPRVAGPGTLRIDRGLDIVQALVEREHGARHALGQARGEALEDARHVTGAAAGRHELLEDVVRRLQPALPDRDQMCPVAVQPQGQELARRARRRRFVVDAAQDGDDAVARFDDARPRALGQQGVHRHGVQPRPRAQPVARAGGVAPQVHPQGARVRAFDLVPAARRRAAPAVEPAGEQQPVVLVRRGLDGGVRRERASDQGRVLTAFRAAARTVASASRPGRA